MLKQLQKTLMFFVAIVLLLAVSVTGAQTQPVLRIGVLDDERGPIANGALMAAQKINESGGVRLSNGTTLVLELVVESFDDETALNQAITNLDQADVVAILGPQSKNDVLNAMPLLQNMQVPVITPAIDSGIIALDSTGKMFRSTPSETFMGRALADYLVNEAGSKRIATVQLGNESTGGVISFISTASALGATVDPVLRLDNAADIGQTAQEIMASNADIPVTYGDPVLANQLLLALREAGWTGLFANDHVEDERFQQGLNASQLTGVLSAVSWSPAAADSVSETFFESYFRTYGDVPGPVQAASYDAVKLLAEAAGMNGDLPTSLTQLDNIRGVQGILRPVTLDRGETNSNIIVVQFSELGALGIAARYLDEKRITDEQLDSGLVESVTPTPTITLAPQVQPTPLPDAVVNTNSLNVRNNPGQGAPILTSVSRDTTLTIVGRLADNSWLQVMLPNGTQGWVFTNLLRLNKDLASVPVLNIPVINPPTPTPIPPTQPAANVIFVADRYTISLGECVTVSWNVSGANVSQVVFSNPNNNYSNEPVNFVDARTLCLESSVIGTNTSVLFTLGVIGINGSYDQYYVQINILQPGTQPAISIVADRYYIKPAECLTVSWNVTGLQTGDVVQLNEITVNGSGSQYVCPSVGFPWAYYYINVLRGGVIATNGVTININEAY